MALLMHSLGTSASVKQKISVLKARKKC